jgi:CRP/FNR family cyclic AMP-dependent transcriptional regulator
MILKIAEAGELLGLPATLSGKPYEVTAEVSEQVRVNFVPRTSFLCFMQAHPEAVIQVVAHLRLRRLALRHTQKSTSFPGG